MMFGDAELLQDGSARLPGQPLVPLFPGRQEQVVVPGLLDEPERAIIGLSVENEVHLCNISNIDRL